MKHFIAGYGERNFINYLLYICVGLSPLFHIYVIGSEMNFMKNSIIYFGSHICRYFNYCSNL